MNPTHAAFAQPSLDLYLLDVALAATVSAGLGLLAARVLASRPTPLRHGVLLAALVLVLLAPPLAAVSLRCGFGLVGAPALAVAAGGTASAPAPDAASATPTVPIDGADDAPGFRRRAAEARRGGAPAVPSVGLETARMDAAPAGTDLAPAPRRSVAAAARSWLAGLLIAAWGVGAAWQAALLAHGLRLLRRLRRSLRRPSDPRWAGLAVKAARAVGLARPPEVALSDLVSAPASFGVFRPVVVIPAALERRLTDGDVEGVLLHESAHVGLRDHLAGFVQRLAGALFWWHPLVRRLLRVLDEVKEERCDDHVIQALGDGVAFAGCLVRLAEWTGDGTRLPTAVGVLGGRRSLERRVLNLLRKDRHVITRRTRAMTLALALFVTAAACLAAACTLRAAAPPEKPAPALASEAGRPSEDLRRLVDRLGDDDFREREKADAELRKMGAAALPALREGLKRPDAEVRSRAGNLIAAIEATIDPEMKRVKALGGDVERDDRDPAHPIVKVKLSTTGVTDFDLKTLAALKDLKELNLARTEITDAGLEELAACKKLRSLNLTQTYLTDAGLKNLAALQDLEELNLSMTSVSAAGLKELAALRSLRTLDLAGAKVTDDGLRELAALNGLRALNVSGLTDRNMKEVAALKGLRSLGLIATGVTDAGLKELTALPDLNELNLDQTDVTAAGLKELAALHTLQTLDLTNTKLKDAGLKDLAALKGLRRLVLTNTDVTDAGLQDLAALEGLQALDLIHTRTSDAGLKELTALKDLRTLNLQGTRVTDAGLKELAALKRLRWLSLFDCADVTDAAVAEFQKALPECEILR